MSAHIEDIEWLVDSGLSLAGTAMRVGVRTESLVRRLQRCGRRDLLSRLVSREPEAERCPRCGVWLLDHLGLVIHQRDRCPGGTP